MAVTDFHTLGNTQDAEGIFDAIADFFQNNQSTTTTTLYTGLYQGMAFNASSVYTDAAGASVGLLLGTETVTIAVGGCNRVCAMKNLMRQAVMYLVNQDPGVQSSASWAMGASADFQTNVVTFTRL